MGLTALLTRTCKETCVYWGNPANDGEGGKTFDDPVELYCRWEELNQVVTDNKGAMTTSRAVVYLLQDVDEEGMLYLGTLESLYDDYATESSASVVDNPIEIEGAYVIKRFEKLPVLGSTTEFTRRVYLTPSLSFGGF